MVVFMDVLRVTLLYFFLVFCKSYYFEALFSKLFSEFDKFVQTLPKLQVWSISS